jgi:hypothetical protein
MESHQLEDEGGGAARDKKQAGLDYSQNSKKNSSSNTLQASSAYTKKAGVFCISTTKGNGSGELHVPVSNNIN